MAQYTGGCLQLNIPAVILNTCHQLEEGQTVEMHGSNVKQGTRKVKNAVKIFAEKRHEMLSFSLFTAAMGDVFQKKVTQTWRCEVNVAQVPPHVAHVKTEHVDVAYTNAQPGTLTDPGQHTDADKPPADPDICAVLQEPTTKEDTEEPATDAEPRTLGELTASLGLDTEQSQGEDHAKVEAASVEGRELEDGDLAEAGLQGVDLGSMALEEADLEESELMDVDDYDGDDEELDSTSPTKRSPRTPTVSEPLRTRSKTPSTQPKSQPKSPRKRGKPHKEPRKETNKEARTKNPGSRKRYAPKDAKPSELTCEFCHRSWFATVNMYNKHMRTCPKNPDASEPHETQPQDEMFTCDICQLSTPSLAHLKRHRKAIHNIVLKRRPEPKRNYLCRYCGEVFHWRTTFNEHVKFRCAENPEREAGQYCRHCRQFVSAAGMAAHVAEKHPDGGGAVCDVCGAVFSARKYVLRHHRDVHLKDLRKKYKCELCGTRFLYRAQLNRHMSAHSETKSFPCDICGKTYKFAECLNRHKRFHHENKYTYHCDKCGHGVEKLAYLKAHVCGRVRRHKAIEQLEQSEQPQYVEVHLGESQIIEQSEFEEVQQPQMDVSRVKFEEVQLEESQLDNSQVKFEVQLEQSQIGESQLKFEEVQLEESQIEGSNLEQSQLIQVQMDQTSQEEVQNIIESMNITIKNDVVYII